MQQKLIYLGFNKLWYDIVIWDLPKKILKNTGRESFSYEYPSGGEDLINTIKGK